MAGTCWFLLDNQKKNFSPEFSGTVEKKKLGNFPERPNENIIHSLSGLEKLQQSEDVQLSEILVSRQS